MRIRSTKPEFWRSERIASVDWEDRLLLKGLESYVDDNGVGKRDIALITGDLFQRDLIREHSRTLARVSEGISRLSAAGLVWLYEAEGTALLFISFWETAQRVDKPQPGRFPRPDGTMNYKDSVIREPGAKPREHSRILAPGTGEQRNRGTGEQRAPKPSQVQRPSTPLSVSERSAPPPEFCSKHHGGTDKPCRACQRHREAREQWDAEQADREKTDRRAAVERRRDCADCEGTGWRLDSPDDQAVRCDHSGLRLVHSAKNTARATR